jgi:hypothetical protein
MAFQFVVLLETEPLVREILSFLSSVVLGFLISRVRGLVSICYDYEACDIDSLLWVDHHFYIIQIIGAAFITLMLLMQ